MKRNPSMPNLRRHRSVLAADELAAIDGGNPGLMMTGLIMGTGFAVSGLAVNSVMSPSGSGGAPPSGQGPSGNGAPPPRAPVDMQDVTGGGIF
jgi:hypothetical protein